MIFGKDRDRGIRLQGLTPEIVSLGKGISEDDLLFHDEHVEDPSLAFLLSRMTHPEYPEPIGVFRDIEKPVYEDAVDAQLALSVENKGAGDLDSLLNSGDTWVVQ